MLRMKHFTASVTLLCLTNGFAGGAAHGSLLSMPVVDRSVTVCTATHLQTRPSQRFIYVNELPENIRPRNAADGSPARELPIQATQATIRSVVDLLRDLTGVQFVLDESAMVRAEVSLDAEVTVRAERLAGALDQLRDASEHKLAYAYHRPTGLVLLTADAEDAQGAASDRAMQLHSAYERAERSRKAGSKLGSVLSGHWRAARV